ncbi:hypothetical protein [Jannaschia donghaensis]|nr:hypothetical protein [Jannaschia donghaensis]
MKLDRPRLYVDFNEMQSDKRVLLSKTDSKLDSEGNVIQLSEGLSVYIYQDDPDIDGQDDNLIADGTCVKNDANDWSRLARWSCEIDQLGIRHQSDIPKLDQES